MQQVMFCFGSSCYFFQLINAVQVTIPVLIHISINFATSVSAVAFVQVAASVQDANNPFHVANFVQFIISVYLLLLFKLICHCKCLLLFQLQIKL